MRLLLDTQAFIWHREGSASLGASARAIIGDESNQIFISTVTVWEIAIKTELGKLRLSRPIQDLLELYRKAGAAILPITPEHAITTGSLPRHHRDPFDRLLIAQALQENLTIVTKDEMIRQYAVPHIW